MPCAANARCAASWNCKSRPAAHARASCALCAGHCCITASTASRTRSLALWSATALLAARMCSRRVSAHSAAPASSWVRPQHSACSAPHSAKPASKLAHSSRICRTESGFKKKRTIKKQTPLLEMITRGWVCCSGIIQKNKPSQSLLRNDGEGSYQFFKDCMGAGRRPPRLMNTEGSWLFTGMMGP